MKLDKTGAELIMKFEGLSLKPYLDSVKVPTIGYGSTFYPSGSKVKMTDKPITKEYAFEIFFTTASKFANSVNNYIKKPVTQNQFNAVVSLAYNIGLGNFSKSTLLKKLNSNPNDATIKQEFEKWNKAGGVVVKGLTNRRKQESEVYFS